MKSPHVPRTINQQLLASQDDDKIISKPCGIATADFTP